MEFASNKVKGLSGIELAEELREEEEDSALEESEERGEDSPLVEDKADELALVPQLAKESNVNALRKNFDFFIRSAS